MKFGGSMKAYLYDVDIWQNKELAPNLMQQPVQMMAQPVYRVPPIPVLVKTQPGAPVPAQMPGGQAVRVMVPNHVAQQVAAQQQMMQQQMPPQQKK